jgi:surface polysaccharide O-acyltransferase-like enzyme
MEAPVNSHNLKSAIVGIVALIGFLMLASGNVFGSMVFGVIGWALIFSGSLHRKPSTQSAKLNAAQSAFEALDMIAMSKRWVGKASEVAMVKHAPNNDDPSVYEVHVLARTPCSSWFITELLVSDQLAVSMKQLTQINERGAKGILKDTPDVYERFFGTIDVA